MTNLRVNTDSRMMVYTETNRKGGDPSLLFEILESAIKNEDWLYLTDDSGQTLGSFVKYIQAPYPVGCGMEPDKLMALLQVQHKYESDNDIAKRMESLRDTVKLMLYGELPLLPRNGEIGRNHLSFGITKAENDQEYAVRRLKRDHPALAQRVMNGELSANAAAIEAGFRQRRVAINASDMQSAAQTLLDNLSPEQLDELIAQLQAHRG